MIVDGIEALADAFGISHQSVAVWQRAGMPVYERGGANRPSRFDLAECVNWLVAREVAKVLVETPQNRLARLQADGIEHENELRRRQLIPADKIDPLMRERVRRIAAMLAATRERCLPELAASSADRAQLTTILERAHADVLRQIAQTAGMPAAQDSDGPAAK